MMVKKNIIFFLLILAPFIIQAQNKIDLSLNLIDKQLPFGLTKKIPNEKPSVGLVLSGGGARAISHIGVLRAIEELKIPIDYIVGTSMGSVVGGLYSAGYSIDEIDSLLISLDWNNLFSSHSLTRKNLFIDQKVTEDKALLSLRLDGLNPVIPKSINTGQKISNVLTLLTLNAPINNFSTFDELLYKFRAVSTDLISGKKVVLKNGSLSKAMRASSSVSFVLPPINIGSSQLVDGGLVDNLPIKTAVENDVDFIIASDATSELKSESELNFPWEIADQIVSIPTKIIKEQYENFANILISQELNNHSNNDFSILDSVVLKGYKNSMKKLRGTNNLINKNFRKNIIAERTNLDKNVYTNLKLPKNPNQIELKLFEKYLSKGSVSNSDILFDLYSIYASGDYKSISASILLDTVETLKVNFTKNDIVQSININGVSTLENETVEQIFKPLLHKPYNSEKILSALLKTLKLYRANGYALATVDTIDFASDKGKLHIIFSEGIINNVEINGNSNTNEGVITRELSTEEGDLLKYENIKHGLENLSATGLFSSIDLEFEKVKANHKLKINLEEKLPLVLRFGLRIDNENFSQLAVDLRNENLFGTATEFGASIAGGIRNLSLLVEHKANRIFNTYLTYKIQGFYKFNNVNLYKDDIILNERKLSRSKIAEYRQNFYGTLVGIGAHLKKIGTLTAEGKYQINRIDDLSNFSSSRISKIKISSLKFKLQVDTQDKYPFPTSGSSVNTYYETAQKILGGDVSYAKFSLNYKGYFTASPKHTIAPSIEFGFADETLPLTQHFSFGGQKSFLGYRDYEYRGRQIFIAATEYRYKLPIKIYFDTYLKVKYNIGSIWAEQEQIRFKDLKHGIGLTVSFDTPIGPADFSVGKSFVFRNTLPKNIISSTKPFFYFTIGYYY
ncbi:MAG: patatin-like phospholipase family protein [Melioribacteraceae bacterium]